MNEMEHELNQLKKYTHLATGFECLDLMKGITTEDFLVISGDTGSGKSTVALAMACNMAKNGNTVVYLNAENSPKVIVDAIKNLGFNFDKDFGEFKKGVHRLIIYSMNDIKFADLEKLLILHEPKALFIDLFSSLLDGQPTYMTAQLTAEYAKKISFYPQKYNCAIIATEQFCKDNKRISRPNIGDIAGGAGLSRKATKVLLIYRLIKTKAEAIMNRAANQSVTEHSLTIADISSELLTKKDRLGFWKDGFFPVKYVWQEGFSILDPNEMADYKQVAFPSLIGGKK